MHRIEVSKVILRIQIDRVLPTYSRTYCWPKILNACIHETCVKLKWRDGLKFIKSFLRKILYFSVIAFNNNNRRNNNNNNNNDNNNNEFSDLESSVNNEQMVSSRRRRSSEPDSLSKFILNNLVRMEFAEATVKPETVCQAKTGSHQGWFSWIRLLLTPSEDTLAALEAASTFVKAYVKASLVTTETACILKSFCEAETTISGMNSEVAEVVSEILRQV